MKTRRSSVKSAESTMDQANQAEGALALRPTFIAMAAIGALATAAAFWMAGRFTALSVALGVVTALLDLLLLARMVRGFLGQRRGGLPWGVVAVLKFVLLFGGLFVLTRFGLIEVLPFLLGFGCLPLGIVAAQFGGAGRTQGDS